MQPGIGETVVNNYYGSDAPADMRDASYDNNDPGYQDQGGSDQSDQDFSDQSDQDFSDPSGGDMSSA